MDYNFLSNLSLEQLVQLKKCLLEDNDNKGLLTEIDKAVSYKTFCYRDFCSDRLPNYRKENEEYYLELAKQINLRDVPFLCDSLNARIVNNFPCPRFYLDDNYSLFCLENWFKEILNMYRREGGYNTYNYIKNYIYYLLLNDSNVGVEDIFKQYEEKKLLAKEHVSEIASYLYEYLKNIDGLYLSIGRQGIANTARRTNNSVPLSPYQEKLVSAVAFGTSYEKLEDRNYEDSKRLLFIK